MMNHLPRAGGVFTTLVLLAGLMPVRPAHAWPAPPAAPSPAPVPAVKERPREVPLADRIHSPYEADRPVADKLRSPRETVKTLLFAAITYDLFPRMIDDAVACLDLDDLQPRPSPQDAAMLALDLEDVLQCLALPLGTIPDQGVGTAVVLYDADGIRLGMCRGPDGWRFDAETLGRLPFLRQAARALARRGAGSRAGLRDGFTDPRTTMRQFIIDVAHGDYYAAARALDLSSLSSEQRRQQGPALAQQLAFALQRRGFVFRQEVPARSDGPPFTWHADRHGRIALERVRQADGKDAWLFTRQTVRNVARMYAAVKDAPPDPRYARLNLLVPPLQAAGSAVARKRPEEVPAHLGSPRALLQGFFRAMDAADSSDARLTEALEYLDLDNVPLADRAALGGKLAAKLEAVLRKIPIDLSAIPADWNASPQVLGEGQGVRIEIVRQRDGCWCFSAATIERVPEMFDKIATKGRGEQGRDSHQDSARDLVMTFQSATARRDYVQAARCLNLGEIHGSAREELGPVLAFKLKYVLDRLGRIYIQEVPDKPEGPRYILYRGELGRIVIDRRANDPDRGLWQFTPETVRQIDCMFRAVLGKPLDASQQDGVPADTPSFWETPGVWLRLHLPAWAQRHLGRLALYQWLGLVVAALLSWAAARVALAGVTQLTAWLLRRSGSALSGPFVASTLRPLQWFAAVWTFFVLLTALDLPVSAANTVFAAEKFLLATLVGWVGLRFIDLSMGIYTNTELLRPHRNLSDMIVPVSMRMGKTAVLLVVATYIVYQVGEIDLLGRFLTGLGVAGLAASLAAQDALKSFFGTLLLIGERAFKIGDRILVSGTEGVVEQVGFRSTRLRTAEDSVLTLPNAIIAAAAIDNMGARSHRRFNTTVVVSPDTPLDRLLEFRTRLQTWLREQPRVVRDKVDVHVHQVTSQGVELTVSLFLDTVVASDETRFREEANCEILRQAADLGVDVAPVYHRLLETVAGRVEKPTSGHGARAA